MSSAWLDDDELLTALRAALTRPADAPPHIVAAAKRLFTWRTIDEELATEVSGTGLERLLTFEGGGLRIEISTEDDALPGQVMPPTAGEIDVQAEDGTTSTVVIDDAGGFVVRPRPDGTVRLRCRPVSGRPVVTGWVTL